MSLSVAPPLLPPEADPSALSVIAGLAGGWVVMRRYAGAGDSHGARFVGTAVGTRSGGTGLRFHESGRLMLADGRVSEAFQTHRYRATAVGLTIDFADGPRDGQRFVEFNLSGAGVGRRMAVDAVHECAPDLYRLRYRFALPGGFITLVLVSGPRKDYRVVSRYRRPSPEAGR